MPLQDSPRLSRPRPSLERRKLQLMRNTGRKLHAGHFAFMRALVEGLDLNKSWDRYLATEGNRTDQRVVRSTIAWIRSEFAAAAKRENRPGTARLVLLNLGGPPQDSCPRLIGRKVAAHAGGVRPGHWHGGFQRGRANRALCEEFGKAAEEDPKQRSKLQRRARLIKRQLLALDWLEQSVSQLPVRSFWI